jgi:hypothetical protein
MDNDVQQIVWAELNHMRLVGAIGAEYDGAEIAFDRSTSVFDINGDELFFRIPVIARSRTSGYVDFARAGAFGEPVIAVAPDAAWDPDDLIKRGIEAAEGQGIVGVSDQEVRFVAFSFPKLGLQFMRDGREIALLELHTWTPVPPSRRTEEQYLPPSNFERWSYLEEMPGDLRATREREFEARIDIWRANLQTLPDDLRILPPQEFERFLPVFERIIINRSRQLHYSSRLSDHEICYELRGQETNVWCVGASVQMLLDFYRYEYSQVRLASELGLGTLSNPNGLPYARVNDVVTVIEKLTCNALNATINSAPHWNEFESEINANRPLISIVPGHCRTVAGYTRSLLTLFGLPPFRGLLVYDPWPPNAGVITRWENFNTQIYQYTYTARVCMA